MTTDAGTRPRTKEGLAATLTDICELNGFAHLDKLMEPVQDPGHGTARKHFTHALQLSARPEALDELAKIADDPDIKNTQLISTSPGAVQRRVMRRNP